MIPSILYTFPFIVSFFLFIALWQLNGLIYSQGKDLVMFNVSFVSLLLFIFVVSIIFFITNYIGINNINNFINLIWLELGAVGIPTLILFAFMTQSKIPGFRFNIKKINKN
jgi:hypothetical protein